MLGHCITTVSSCAKSSFFYCWADGQFAKGVSDVGDWLPASFGEWRGRENTTAWLVGPWQAHGAYLVLSPQGLKAGDKEPERAARRLPEPWANLALILPRITRMMKDQEKGDFIACSAEKKPPHVVSLTQRYHQRHRLISTSLPFSFLSWSSVNECNLRFLPSEWFCTSHTYLPTNLHHFRHDLESPQRPLHMQSTAFRHSSFD